MGKIKSNPKIRPSPPRIEELEPRILYSADFAPEVIPTLGSSPVVAEYRVIEAETEIQIDDFEADTGEYEIIIVDESELQAEDTAVLSQSAESSTRELVIVDTATPDYQQLIDDILAQSTQANLIEVVLLDSSRNGFEQLNQILSGYSGLNAVHLISHGGDGAVSIGNSTLDKSSLTPLKESIESWGDAFSAEGDFLIYGCNLAASETGEALIDSIAALTGADVAASDDLTGQAELGGDWDLEYSSGSIETNEAVSRGLQVSWKNILDNTAPTLNNLDGAPSFTEDGAAVVLDADVDIGDSELDALNSSNGDYDGASITLVRNAGVSTEDIFSFNDANGITLSGGNLIKNSQIIGSFDITTTLGQLVISFTNANGETPTSVDVDNILRQITYANSSDTPPVNAQINWTFNDGNTGTQGTGGALGVTGSTTVSINAINDAPTSTGGSVTEAINTHHTFSWSDFNVSDVDTPITAQMAVRIDTLPTSGTLEYDNGSTWKSVSTGQLLTKATLDAGLVRFVPVAGETGFDGYSNPGAGNGFNDYAQITYTAINSTSIGMTNPGGESNALAESGFINPAIGWTTSSSAGAFNPSTTAYSVDHDNVFYVDQGSTLTQTLGTTFLSSNDYSLNLEIGWRAEFTNAPEFRAELWAGVTRLGFIDQTDVTLVKGELVSGTLSIDGSSFAALNGQSLQIRLFGAVGFNQTNFDNLVLSAFDRTSDVATAAAVMSVDIIPVNDAPTFVQPELITNGTFDVDLSNWTTTGTVGPQLNGMQFGGGECCGAAYGVANDQYSCWSNLRAIIRLSRWLERDESITAGDSRR